MLMRDISVIERKLRTYADNTEVCQGLGFPEQVVLMYLRSNGTAKQETIASYLEIDKGSIAKTVSKLEEKGLITRCVNPASKREKLVSLSEAGEDIMAGMKTAYDGIYKQVFAGMTKKEIESACKLVAKIAANVEKM